MSEDVSGVADPISEARIGMLRTAFTAGGGYTDDAAFLELVALLRRIVAGMPEADALQVAPWSAQLLTQLLAGNPALAERSAALGVSVADLPKGTAFDPFGCFKMYEACTRLYPEGDARRALTAALAAVGAPDNPWIAGAVAQEMTSLGMASGASAWYARSRDSFFTEYNRAAFAAETPAGAWYLGERLKAELTHAQAPYRREQVRLAILERLAHLHVPDYSRLTGALAADGDRFGVPAVAWSYLGHPAVPNLLTSYLGLPIPQATAGDIPGGSATEVFPAGAQPMPAEGFFGPTIAYEAPKAVAYGAGVVHVVPKARVYVDLWKTAVWTNECFLEHLSHGPGALAYAAERMNYLGAATHGLRRLEGRTALVSKRSAWEWYAHWITEVLPLVGMIKEAGHDFDHIVAFHSGSSYCREGFEALGIKPAQIIDGTDWVYASADTAVVPRAALTMSGETPLSDFARGFVKGLFLADPPATRRRRIYVSRRKARTRRLLNEPEVEAVLAAHGFETVDLEDLTMRAKARLLNECEAVAGLYGAGLGNLLFCEPGTKVLEIRPHRSNWWIQHLAAGLKLPYVCVTTEVPSGDDYDQYTDQRVDTDCVRQGVRVLSM